ncbi:MAG: AhpC/TSA family protein [Actinobacteria bacterium]|nr:AhpC/TSA family protein [Actinomycetota bacterium]
MQRRDRLDEVGALPVFVVHDEPDLVQRTMLEDVELPYPVLVDLEREAYAAWGLRRASAPTIFLDLKVWWQYLKIMVGGDRLRKSGQDPLQLGGAFLVAPDGTVAYSRPQRRDDRPPVGELVDRLERLAAGADG